MGKKSLMDEAISAQQKGQTEQAIKILEIITLKEPDNEEAWMQLSRLVKHPWQEAKCLNKLILINPDNRAARQRLEQVDNLLREKKQVESDLRTDVPVGPPHALNLKVKIRDSDILPEDLPWWIKLLGLFFGWLIFM